ncbi:MAG: 50S ribosome-binding GTPase [Alphaproteobacteria bacterium]|nr:MAG: 50S ribosome-binding GTPase [Alphaproteobacteria bacterium]
MTKVFDHIPNVVLLGETNVGKSSLFNKLVGNKISLVGDVENLTRDVIVYSSSTGFFNLVDLPGVNNVQEIDHFLQKLPSISGFIIVIDDKGWTNKSKRFLQYANQSGQKVAMVLNKIDLPHSIERKKDLDLHLISVKRNHGINDLNNYISSWFNDKPEDIKAASWAFIGRSNVGKSTILNHILNQERFVVENAIGTTQEVNSVKIESKNRVIQVYDTPGYRKSSNLSDLEQASQYRLLNIFKSDVQNFIVLLDLTSGITKVDFMLMNKIWSQGKGLIVALGMWDKVNDMTVLSNAKIEIQKRFYGVKCIPVSGKTGFGLNNLFNAMTLVESLMKKKIKTSELNKWFEKMKNKDVVSSYGIKYITQVGTSPPSFMFFTNKELDATKLRFLEHSMAEFFNLSGVHLNLLMEKKDRKKLIKSNKTRK